MASRDMSSLPRNGDILSGGDRIFSWARLLAPFFVGIIGAMIGGFASFTITKEQVMHNTADIVKLEQRVNKIENDQSLLIERMARVETKIDVVLDRLKN